MNADRYAPGEIIVIFVDGTTEDEARHIIAEAGFTISTWIAPGLTIAYVNDVPHGEEVAACSIFNAMDSVEHAERSPLRGIAKAD